MQVIMASNASDRFRHRTGLYPSPYNFSAFQGMCVGGLDASTYIPGSMASPGAMILPSPTGSDISQRTGFLASSTTSSPHQGLDKEPSSPLSNSLAPANFPQRPMFPQADSYTSLPDHLLSIHPNMVNARPSLDSQMVFVTPNGSGNVFRTVSSPEDRNGFHGSAFVPAKCLKLEKHSSGAVIQPLGLPIHYHSNGSCGFINSPPVTTTNPTTSSGSDVGSLPPAGIKEERMSEKEHSENTDKTADTSENTMEEEEQPVLPEEGRILRKTKRKGPFDGQCPLCGVTVRVQELLSHFEQEVEKLGKISKSIKLPAKEVAAPLNKTYHRVKSNRQNRLTARAAKGKKKRSDDANCPVCNERLSGTPEELTTHVEQCLKRREECDSEDEPVDVEGDDTFEEYEWAGQKRIRVTTLLQGGFLASGFQIGKHSSDDDEDLNVDGDDSSTYGLPQYTEADVIPCSTDEPTEDRERQELRKALLINSPVQQRILESSKWSTNSGEGDGCVEVVNVSSSADSEQRESGSDQLITSLKEKIKDLEELQKSGGDRMKCLICMEPYTKPVVSVCCWHVHCEECWLRTLGVKKLCPQCNMITSPVDLRRIYL